MANAVDLVLVVSKGSIVRTPRRLEDCKQSRGLVMNVGPAIMRLGATNEALGY